MRRALGVYQYLGPLLLLPIGYWLWWRCCEQDHRLVILIMSMPILFSYLVPAIGANVLGLWEFHICLRWGRVRPHHGFVFGSATSMFAAVCLGPEPVAFGLGECFRAAFLLGSVLAFWNWFYDIMAIKANLITVYNRPFSEGRGPATIATDYAPVLFGTFGACYGVAICVCRHYLPRQGQWEVFWWLFAPCNLAVIFMPVGAYVLSSYWKTGTAGLTPCYPPESKSVREVADGEREVQEASVVSHLTGDDERDEP